MNPSVSSALLRLSASASQDEDFFAALARQALDAAKLPDGSLDRVQFTEQAPSVRVRMWKQFMRQNGCESYTDYLKRGIIELGF
jgi:hypothetical protein